MSINVCNDRSMASITSLPSGVSGSSLVLIKTLTASGDNELDFNDGSSDVVLDSTYKEYIFKFINMHASNDGTGFAINLRTGSSGSYSAATKTTTFFVASHNENDGAASLGYDTGDDLAQSTGDVTLTGGNVGNGNDESVSGEMHLFDPSSTTFVKHFIARSNINSSDDKARNNFIAGYANTTSAITSVRFKMVAGTLDSGTVKLYGVS